MVDFDALRGGLGNGHIVRASLDAVHPEPLPAGHWMYQHPLVQLSPHISWNAPSSHGRMLQAFLDNLRRCSVGEPLPGIVDIHAGY
ncbi:MAG: hypothetical protein GYB41_13535 [Oceanospirillales bacterium]|nr:hypothetical protein [Oceanospirillales bacterium]